MVVDGGYIGTGYHSVAVHVAVHKVGVVTVEQPVIERCHIGTGYHAVTVDISCYWPPVGL